MESLVGMEYRPPFGCWRLVHLALREHGVDLPDFSEGISESDRAEVIRRRLAQLTVPVENPDRGDIVLVKILGQPGHVGIMLNEAQMLHCMANMNAVIEAVDSPRWTGRILGYFRVA